MKLSEEQIEAIASGIQIAVQSVATDHYNAKTQEHQLTSRIGQAIEHGFRDGDYGNAKVSVITQDIPDKGRGSMEKRLGGDLYIGVSLEGEYDKGLLIQAKWKGNNRGLVEQCKDMLGRTRDSYVWEYGPRGVRVKQARSIVRADHLVHGDSTWSTNVRRQFKRVLECKSGDKKLGIPPGPDRRSRVGQMLDALAVDTAVSVTIEPTD